MRWIRAAGVIDDRNVVNNCLLPCPRQSPHRWHCGVGEHRNRRQGGKIQKKERERRMINVGDAVVWFSGSRRGRRVSMRKGIGTVKKIEGDAAVIVTDLGSRVRKPLSVLRLKTNDTTYSIFEEVAKIL